MQKLGLFNMAFRQQEWLAERQSVIAGNIANANTPGYAAKDVAPFRAVLEASEGLARTNSGHFGIVERASTRPATSDAGGSIDRKHSNNDVEIEKEFLKSGEVMRSYALTTQVIKSFHNMILTSSKV